MTVFFKEGAQPIFYIHVPKTGGTYIEDLFRANGYERMLWESRPAQLGLVCSFQHMHRALYEQVLLLDKYSLIFMTVRNPVDRLLSEYRNQTARKKTPIIAWLKKIHLNMRKNIHSHDNHFCPQVDFYRPGVIVFKQEDGFNDGWADNLSASHNLGFSVLSVKRRRNTKDMETSFTSDEWTGIHDFCQNWYRDDFKYFGYDILKP